MDRAEKDMIARYRARIMTLAPLVLLAAFAYHPFIANLTNAAAVEAEAHADTLRWGIAHVAVAVGAAHMILAYIALREFLHEAGEDRHSRRGLPLLALGGALYAVLPGIELGAIAVVEMGGSATRMQEIVEPWFLPILMTGALLNAIGLMYFARAIRAAGVLAPMATTLVTIALVVMALSRFVPLGLVQFYVQGIAGVVALGTLARAIRAGAGDSVVHPATAVTAT